MENYEMFNNYEELIENLEAVEEALYQYEMHEINRDAKPEWDSDSDSDSDFMQDPEEPYNYLKEVKESIFKGKSWAFEPWNNTLVFQRPPTSRDIIKILLSIL